MAGGWRSPIRSGMTEWEGRGWRGRSGKDGNGVEGVEIIPIFAQSNMVVESADNEIRSKISPSFWRRLPSQRISMITHRILR